MNEIYNHNCELCPLHAGDNKIVCMPGRTANNAIHSRAMIIGEAPGAKEDETGVPFIGKSGSKLWQALENSDSFLAHCGPEPFITNSVKCRPNENATPLFSHVDACFSYLEKEVELVNPVAIMTLGNRALYAITGIKEGVSKLAGLWRKVSRPNHDPLLVIPNFHPAYVMKNPHKQHFFEEVVDDFVKVWHYGVKHNADQTWRYARP